VTLLYGLGSTVLGFAAQTETSAHVIATGPSGSIAVNPLYFRLIDRSRLHTERWMPCGV
jgi:hypothetical protein